MCLIRKPSLAFHQSSRDDPRESHCHDSLAMMDITATHKAFRKKHLQRCSLACKVGKSPSSPVPLLSPEGEVSLLPISKRPLCPAQGRDALEAPSGR